MKNSRRTTFTLFVLLLAATARAQTTVPAGHTTTGPFATKAEAETFLRQARIVSAKGTSLGTTHPVKLLLEDGSVRHYAVFKSIDERKHGMTQLASSLEFDFKDSWMFEVAAYELDKLLGLDMVPVTVERTYSDQKGSLQIWVDDCMMESDRLKNNRSVPDTESWNNQMFKVRVFDNLVFNIDRNLGNLLITPEWKCLMIDHSRTFKSTNDLRTPKDLTRFSRSMMEGLAKLDAATIKTSCGKYLSGLEIKTMMNRRDKLVSLYQRALQAAPATVYP
jgi:hypothetical protein